MTTRSPALERVCEAAVTHFAIHGYDGASLNEIAAMIGIKKASLYFHFSSKDALFLQVLEDAIQVETTFVEQLFAGAVEPGCPGAAYVNAIAERHKTSVHLRYLLRTVYLPPAALKDAIGKAYEGFLELVRQGFMRQLAQAQLGVLTDVEAERYSVAYIGIIESLFVELTYAGHDQMDTRREALWQLLIDSLALRKLRPAGGATVHAKPARTKKPMPTLAPDKVTQ